ncbi:MAG: hypothetical protein BWY55_00466 [archaeon ADurb.Bin336]|jgi:hypothetical protein|nr:MAG: hypothetical protein BWY55_00466 [archaeon ADurb.Bin336]
MIDVKDSNHYNNTEASIGLERLAKRGNVGAKKVLKELGK